MLDGSCECFRSRSNDHASCSKLHDRHYSLFHLIANERNYTRAMIVGEYLLRTFDTTNTTMPSIYKPEWLLQTVLHAYCHSMCKVYLELQNSDESYIQSCAACGLVLQRQYKFSFELRNVTAASRIQMNVRDQHLYARASLRRPIRLPAMDGGSRA